MAVAIVVIGFIWIRSQQPELVIRLPMPELLCLPIFSDVLPIINPVPVNAVFQFSFDGTLPSPPVQIRSNVIKGEIMDWAGPFNQSPNTAGGWHFDSALDLPKMCLRGGPC
jgi:hypothetical protein